VLQFYRELREANNLPIVKVQDYDLKQLQELIESTDFEEGEERLEVWREAILQKKFSFGQDVWKYSVEGKESWLKEAFDSDSPDDFETELALEKFEYKEEFLKSNWKMMHDALLFYRFSVLHDVLPKYKICVA
jgi:hypothetical protein